MREQSFHFPSYSALAEIVGLRLFPDVQQDVKGVVQITHGMAEHKERYLPFMKRLVGAGYAVYIMDLLGHGASVTDPDMLGYFGPDGEEALIQDICRLSGRVRQDFPNKPLFLFGHSMGSFLTRIVNARDEVPAQGAVYCGTGGRNPLAGTAVFLAGLICALGRGKKPGVFLNALAFSAYNKRTDRRTPFDWLSYNRRNVDSYLKDPLCGFLFKNLAFLSLSKIIAEAQSAASIRRIPRDLPILLIAGQDDPVGQYGKGVEALQRELLQTGHAAELKLYSGMRHEILQEDAASHAMQDVIDWLDRQI